MFKYDKDYFSQYSSVAIDFFGSFIWRFFLLNLLISFPVFLLYDVISLITIYLISVILTIIPIYITFKLLLKINHKGTRVQYRMNDDETPSIHKRLMKVSTSLWWRVCFIIIILNIINLVVVHMFGINLPHIPVLMVAILSAWIWLVFFNEKTGRHVQFINE